MILADLFISKSLEYLHGELFIGFCTKENCSGFGKECSSECSRAQRRALRRCLDHGAVLTSEFTTMNTQLDVLLGGGVWAEVAGHWRRDLEPRSSLPSLLLPFLLPVYREESSLLLLGPSAMLFLP